MERWLERDPILLFERTLVERGVATPNELATVRTEVEREIKRIPLHVDTISKARVEQNIGAIVTISLALALGILLPALALVAHDGIDGAAKAWLIGNAIAAVTSLVVAGRTRVMRGALVADAEWLDSPEGDEPTTTRALTPG